MNFSNFHSKVKILRTSKLGGRVVQFKLAPELRKNFNDKLIEKNNPKKAAILALFYPNKNNQLKFILTERANYKGAHAKQISFPGGKCEINESYEETALRETFEEIGIVKDSIEIIRPLTELYIPPSNFLVTPFIGLTTQTPIFNPNYEVASIIEVSIEELFNNSNQTEETITTSYMPATQVPAYKFQNHIIWGATAMILSEIKELLKASL